MTIQAIDLPFDQNLEGYVSGSEISIIQEYTDKAGSGPRLHRHPYSETFIVRRGEALFTAAGEQLVVAGVRRAVVHDPRALRALLRPVRHAARRHRHFLVPLQEVEARGEHRLLAGKLDDLLVGLFWRHARAGRW
jgi:hypothetical protein